MSVESSSGVERDILLENVRSNNDLGNGVFDDSSCSTGDELGALRNDDSVLSSAATNVARHDTDYMYDGWEDGPRRSDVSIDFGRTLRPGELSSSLGNILVSSDDSESMKYGSSTNSTSEIFVYRDENEMGANTNTGLRTHEQIPPDENIDQMYVDLTVSDPSSSTEIRDSVSFPEAEVKSSMASSSRSSVDVELRNIEIRGPTGGMTHDAVLKPLVHYDSASLEGYLLDDSTDSSKVYIHEEERTLMSDIKRRVKTIADTLKHENGSSSLYAQLSPSSSSTTTRSSDESKDLEAFLKASESNLLSAMSFSHQIRSRSLLPRTVSERGIVSTETSSSVDNLSTYPLDTDHTVDHLYDGNRSFHNRALLPGEVDFDDDDDDDDDYINSETSEANEDANDPAIK